MKIIFVTSSLDPGDGWGRYSNALVSEISKDNEVLVVCHSLYEMNGVSQEVILHSPLSMANPLKIFMTSHKIQNINDSFKPDIVHFLVESYVVILPFLRLDKRIKTFLTVHGTYSFIPQMFITEKAKLLIVSPLIKKSYQKINGIIAVSSFTKQYLLKQYKNFYNQDFNPDKIAVISNGIDLGSFKFDLAKEDKQKKSVIFVGATKRRKGILESINSLAEYKHKYGGNFTYTIIGSYDSNDEYVKEIHSRIQELGLSDNVIFSGFVDNKVLQSLYTNADLFIMLPSQSGLSVEGFGLVYLEANAYGVPVIGSKDSGASNAILSGQTGYLVDPFNSKEVSEKIHDILDSASIKPSDCIDWAKKQDIKEKTKLVLDYYKSR